jgi:hypothetical protein
LDEDVLVPPLWRATEAGEQPPERGSTANRLLAAALGRQRSAMCLPGRVLGKTVDPFVLELIVDGVAVSMERVQDASFVVDQQDLGF